MKGDIDFVYGLFGPEYYFLTKTTTYKVNTSIIMSLVQYLFIYFDGQHFVGRIVWLNEKTFFEYFN